MDVAIGKNHKPQYDTMSLIPVSVCSVCIDCNTPACSGAMWSAARKALGQTGQYQTDKRGRHKIPVKDIIKNVDGRIANPKV